MSLPRLEIFFKDYIPVDQLSTSNEAMEPINENVEPSTPMMENPIVNERFDPQDPHKLDYPSSASDDEKIPDADPSSITANDSILTTQMDPRILQTLQLLPSDQVNPYQMTYGRNPGIHSSLLKTLLNQLENPSKSIRAQNILQRLQRLSLSDQIMEVLSSQGLTSEQSRRRWQIAVDVLLILRRWYPSCQVYVFGSLLTGLGDADSDIDIYFDFRGDGGDSLNKQPLTKSLVIYSLQETVEDILTKARCPHSSEKYFAREVELIGTRVPIVRFQHIQTNISVDISFGSRISIQNSKLLMFFMDFDPRVKPFILFLRYWGEFHGIVGSQKIKKYALSLMALVYFTRKKIIPSVRLLQLLSASQRAPGSENPDKVEWWDSSFSTDRDQIDIFFQGIPLPSDYETNPGQELLSMALEFFEMMGTTKFSHMVVCPFIGKIVPKDDFIELPLAKERLPETLLNWRKMYRTDRDFCKEFRIFKPLVIQDPFVLEFNVGGLVDDDTLNVFVRACKTTAKKLKTGPTSILELFQPPSNPEEEDQDSLDLN